jgi:hypothetical protein
MNVEAFEAMRQLMLLVSGLVRDVEGPEQPAEVIEETTVSSEGWRKTVDEAIANSRRTRGSRSRFGRDTVGA